MSGTLLRKVTVREEVYFLITAVIHRYDGVKAEADGQQLEDWMIQISEC